MSLTAALCVNVFNMFLSVFFLSGVWARCPIAAHVSITAPKQIKALSGSCLLIPCYFTPGAAQPFETKRHISGVWIKNDPHFKQNQNVIFNSSASVKTHTVEITGDLRQKNCTTVFSNLFTHYTDNYYFRIENWPFMATASCDPVNIAVKDSPRRPRIEIPPHLKENQSVTITCSALTPCPHSPPQLTWNLQQHSQRQTEQNTDRTFTTKIQENIILSHTHDGNKISCSARYPVNGGKDFKTAKTEVTLSVSYAPKNTSASISPSGLVSVGSWVNLTCSSRAKPPISHFTWFKNSTDGAVKVSEGDFYSFKTTNMTDTGSYYCLAVNDLGSQMSAWIHLNIAESSQVWPSVVAVIVVIVLIFLFVCVWQFKKHQTQQLTQSRAGEANVTEEDLHYGNINFSKRRTECSSASVQHDRQQQDYTLYAQVKVSKPANSLTHTADGSEELYAQVMKN